MTSPKASAAPGNVTAERTEPEIVTAPSIYCLRCRCYTDNYKNLRRETFTRNGKERKIKKALCVKCEKKKNKLNGYKETKRWRHR